MPTAFNDPSVSVIGKIFLAGITASLLGHPSRLKVRGTPEQIIAIKDAILAFKSFQDELANPDATVQSVMDKLQAKNLAAQSFKQVCGIPWPL